MYPIKSSIIEPLKIVGDWNVQSKKLKKKFPQLTDADLQFEAGKEGDLLARLGTRLYKKRDEVINLIMNGQTQNFKAL